MHGFDRQADAVDKALRQVSTRGVDGQLPPLGDQILKTKDFGGVLGRAEAVVDQRFGCFANQDLAGYHIPSHADIPAIEAHFLAEVDDKTNPLRIKGVGELGICGAGAAVANAVYNACGVRIREFPLTVDKVLEGLGERSA